MPSPKSAATLKDQLERSPSRTDRLRLRVLRSSDAKLIFRGYAADPDAVRWMGFRPHENVQVTEKLVARWVAAWDEELGPPVDHSRRLAE